MPEPLTRRQLIEKFSALDGAALMRAFLVEEMPGKIAMVSSFGTESAVLLHMLSTVDKTVPVFFLDTLKHFDETLAYRDALCTRLGLAEVHTLRPDPFQLQFTDPQENLWQKDPDACCHQRKVLPLERALAPFAGWISGRKHFHNHHRAALPSIEFVDNKLKINPLAGYTSGAIRDYFEAYDLPRHPLWEKGYTSVGCASCTQLPVSIDDIRSGRWAGTGKTECGIHLSGTARK